MCHIHKLWEYFSEQNTQKNSNPSDLPFFKGEQWLEGETHSNKSFKYLICQMIKEVRLGMREFRVGRGVAILKRVPIKA